MSFSVDQQGMRNLVAQLAAKGWTGDDAELTQLLGRTNEDSLVRALERYWAWGKGAKSMVMSLVTAARRRGASVMVADRIATGRGPNVTLSFPKGSRLEALQMQVQGVDEVYVIRRFDGDWRSCRTFRPKSKSSSKRK